MLSGDRRIVFVSDGQSRPYKGDCEVGRVLCEPKRQYGKIDVYFQAKVDGSMVSFVIEDKTHTEMHGDQLERYLRKVADDSAEEEFIKPVYLKTGYVFGDEREKARSKGYSVFDGENMAGFLEVDARAGVHEIVRQYGEYMAEQVKYRRRALSEWNLDEGFVQWEFMVHLGQVLQLRPNGWPARGGNLSGDPWTQYPHWKDRGAFYWRLDSRKPLRLMVDTDEAGDQVLDRWDGWSRAFETARNKAGLSADQFRSVKSRRGTVVREGTIGAVDIASCLRGEGLDSCVARVECLHRVFIASLDDKVPL